MAAAVMVRMAIGAGLAAEGLAVALDARSDADLTHAIRAGAGHGLFRGLSHGMHPCLNEDWQGNAGQPPGGRTNTTADGTTAGALENLVGGDGLEPPTLSV